MTSKLPFVSQHKHVHSDIGCGVAATLMLLKAANYRTKSYRQTAIQLQVNVLPSKKWGASGKGYGKGAWARDVLVHFFDQSIDHISVFDPARTELSRRLLQEIAAKPPVMVGMNDKSNVDKWGDGGHWIVIVKATPTSLRYYNPDKLPNEPHEFRMTWTELFNDWDGYAIKITGPKGGA